jgi:nucleoside-diphosphate-sugar epimerase
MSWKDRRALVTGAGGFIGSHLVKRLLDEGAQVHILLKENESTWRIKDGLDRLVVWKSDITDLTSLQSILPRVNPQIIFHLAALVDVSRSWNRVVPMTKTNVLGTINLLTALKQSCFETFIHTSSSEEYGDTLSPCREDQRESPISPYSFSKLSSTHFCQMAAKTFDLPITTVRLFPTYGPFQESSMFVPSAIKSLLVKKEFKMSPGEQKREFNFVDDIVEAYLKVAVCSEAHGEVLNVGNGIPYKLKQVISIIKELIGGTLNIEIGALPYRKGEGSECFCDNHKLRQLTGWSPQVSLEEGLRLTVEWYKSNRITFEPR